MRNLASIAACLVALSVTGTQAQSTLRITEVMSSSGTGGTPDWFELSNLGTNSVDIAGWKMDDNSFGFALSVALNGISNIAAGESVVFFEDSTTNNIASFKSFWGGLTNRQIGTYTGSGVGLSSAGDGVAVFNSSGSEIHRVTFGAATTGTSFYWVYDSSGNLLSATNGVLSAAGTDGAFTSKTNSTYNVTNTASPGTRAAALSLAFTSSGDKFAKTGAAYSYNVTYQKRLSTDPEPTLSAVTKPAWLSLSGTTLTGTPGTNNTGPNQAVTLRLSSVIGGITNTVDQNYSINVYAAQPRIVLNEYNAVGSTSLHSSSVGDLRLGRIAGNGGDWFELVVIGTGFGSTVDMRGWKIDVSQVTAGVRLSDTITLSQNSFWASVPAGSILTFTEDNSAEGGHDTALNADNRLSTAKYSWSNIWLGDSALIASVGGDSTSGIGTSASGINISSDDTQIAVRNASGGYEFGPVGEGMWRYPEINSTSCFYLAADPAAGIYPGQVQADARYSALYFGKTPVVPSTFGSPNLTETGRQTFFGVNMPYFASRPWRFAREGMTTAASVDYRQDDGHRVTFQVRAKTGGSIPSWLSVNGTSSYADISLSPQQGDSASYELELVLTDTANGVQTVEPYNVVVLPASSEVILNEYNAVSSANRLNSGVIPNPANGDGEDTFFGSVDGNGGNWFELVVVGNGTAGTVDMRGWKIEIEGGAGDAFVPQDTLVLSQDSYWAAIPTGTILTFTEKTTAEGGLDTWINKANRLGQAGGSTPGAGGYAWSNINVYDDVYLDQSASVIGDAIGVGGNNTQFRILKPRSGAPGVYDIVAGPSGEGIQPLSGINSTEVLELEADPAPSISPYLDEAAAQDPLNYIYDDGNGSTFGAPNLLIGGTLAQNFSAYQTANSSPVFTNQPAKFAVEGQVYTWTAATADAESSAVTVTKVSGPAWLSVSGKTLSGTPPQGSAGFYDVALAASDGTASTPLQFRLTVFNDNPAVILNEYNAVDNSGATQAYLNGGTALANGDGSTPGAVDTRFGRAPGNGGDWVEFVVTGNGASGVTDLRGWTIEIDEGATHGFAAKIKIKLSNASFWSAVPNGTILTFTEKTSAQGGMDTILNGADNSTTSGWRWSNVWIGDPTLIAWTDLFTNGYAVNGGVVDGINIDDSDTQFRVLNASGNAVFGPAGEGIAPPSGIGPEDVFELEGHPAPGVLPTDRSDDTTVPPKNGYDNSTKGSTFGAPNEWHIGSGGSLTVQNFSAYAAVAGPYDATFDSWCTAAGQPGLSMTSDMDRNGLVALLEYALGAATPGAVPSALLPSIAMTNIGGTNQLVLVYLSRTNGAVLTPETAASLQGVWVTNGVSNTVTGTISTNGTILQQRRASVPMSGTSRFLRIRTSSSP